MCLVLRPTIRAAEADATATLWRLCPSLEAKFVRAMDWPPSVLKSHGNAPRLASVLHLYTTGP